MKIFNQLALILCIWVLGEYLSLLIQNIMVIPGSIIGMILLFACLKFKLIKLEDINEISDFFLDNMAIFFVPAGVSLMNSLDIISENIFVLLISIVVSTVLVMYITGIVVENMIGKKLKENKDV
ncbi:MAG: CidA/LrgA family protein [Peptostreptococcaceae bacterium]